ncbi:MAG: hypothetical protein LBC47_05385 [Tannerella sp.]|nr:hypothetical protein [Tannerella sp.]
MKLKRIFMTVIAVSGCLTGYAQEARVEKSVWGVQAGSLLNICGYNELRLTDAVALRSEIGIQGSFSYSYISSFGSFTHYTITPELVVEPRWYYNLAKRQAKGKFTTHNSGNYLSLRTSFCPEWPAIHDSGSRPVSSLYVIPMWGIRRHYGEHFSFEASAGIGYQHIFVGKGDDTPVIGWRLGIGYTF